MALRDQPYIPLYVQDYLTDEKLNECSASSQGIYIKIMCIMHKSEQYGCILLEQKYKQNDKQIKNFALKISKQLPFSCEEICAALEDLVFNKVLHIDNDILFQKRMVKDNALSNKRSEAGKKGGNANNFAQAKHEAKPQANSEYENEYEDDIESKNDLINTDENPISVEQLPEVSIPVTCLTFDEFWELYDKKRGDKEKMRKKYDLIKEKDRKLMKEHIPKYKASQPEKQYRKDPQTYLNNKSWNDEIIEYNEKNGQSNRNKEATSWNELAQIGANFGQREGW